MALTQTQVSQLYVSVFGRASEGEGNTYWQTDQPDMVTTANVMLDTDAAKDYFGTTLDDDQAFIEHIYLNTLGKTYAEDTEGVDYWVSELAAGKSKGEVITALINAAQATENAGNAQDQFNNKVAVSDYTADTLSTFTTIEDFTAFIADVDETDASVTTAKANVDAAAPIVPGETFTLTENVETITGTNGDDTFNAYTVFTVVGQNDSLQNGDTVNAGDGNDTLIAELVNGAQTAPTLNSVESIQLTDYAGGTLNLSNSTGVETVTVKNSTAATTLSNAIELVDFNVQNISGGNNVTLGYRADALTGETIQTLNLDSLTMRAGGGNIQFEDNEGSGTIETLNINATGIVNVASIQDATAVTSDVLDKLATVAVNATGITNLGTIAAPALTNFDASASTGNVTADISAGAVNDVTVVGGEGDDFITFGNGNLDKNDSIDLGAGDNTLAVTGDVDPGDSLDISNVQTLQVSTTGPNTVNAADVGTGVETFNVVSMGNAHTMTIDEMADDTQVNIQDQLRVDGGADNELAALTLNGANVSADDDVVNIGMINQESGTTATPEVFTVTTVSAAGFENINIDSSGQANTRNAITTLTAASQDAVTITGDTKLTIGSTLIAPTIDASESTGGVDIDVAGTGATGGVQNVTGSAGKDTIRVDTGTLDQDDTTIDAGEGVDTLVFTNAGTLTFNTVTTVQPFDGVSNFEKLSFGDATGATTLQISDAFLDVFSGNTIDVVAPDNFSGPVIAGFNLSLDASDIVTSSATINVDASKIGKTTASTSEFSIAINNGTTIYVGSDYDDMVVVTTGSYLGSEDSMDGGDTTVGGANTLAFSTNSATVIQASQLTGVQNFNNLAFTHDSGLYADAFEITLDNAFASANQDSGNISLTTTDGGGEGDDAFVIDASAFSGAIDVTATTDDTAGTKTTLKLGSGDDTVVLGVGTDKIALGAGDDTVEFATATALNATASLNNTITDFNFGTATGTGANVDQLDVTDAAFALTGKAGGAVISKASAPNGASVNADIAAGANVIILDSQSYTDAAAAEAALTALDTTPTGNNALVVWQDSLGNVKVSHDVDTSNTGAAGVEWTDLATLDGLTISGVSSAVDAGDFAFV